MKRIVIAGFGDTGLLVAINLAKDFEILGITPKPCLVSGQELGTRLTRPRAWKQDYLMPFRRYKKLDATKILQGLITSVDTENSTVTVKHLDGREQQEPYDALVIASGVTNGFWRNNKLEGLSAIHDSIDRAAEKFSKANTIAIIGGGATGVSVSSNLKEQYPEKRVHFFYSQEQALPGYHPKVRRTIEAQLKRQGVHLHPNHRASVPEGFQCETLSTDPISWQSGQEFFAADLTCWTIGNLRPNNSFIPKDMLDEKGFVKADKNLRVPGYKNVFTVGDIAASDPNRSSARNAGFLIVAHNIRAYFDGNDSKMKTYKTTRYRWGSILGVQKNGMRVFTPKGGSVRVAEPLVRKVLFPLFVRKLIYKGIRKTDTQ